MEENYSFLDPRLSRTPEGAGGWQHLEGGMPAEQGGRKADRGP